MTALPAAAMPGTRLAELRARWVPAYRAAWVLLVVAALALLAQPLLHPSSTAAPILLLRLVKAAVLIGVSTILLRRRARDPVAALLSLAFLTWTVTSSFDFASGDRVPMLLDRGRFLLFVLALLLFPDGDWRPGWPRKVAVASALVFVLGVAEAGGILATRFFLPLAIACVIAAVGGLVSKFRRAETEAVRQQLKWVALGLVAGIGLILSARAGLAVSAAAPRLAPMPVLWEGAFQLGIIIVALGFLVSLLRYRLFDAEAAISRSAAFAVLTAAMLAVFAASEAAIQNVGQNYAGMGIANTSAAMAAAVAALLLNPLHQRISAWAEDHFQRDLLKLKRELPELIDDLAGTATTRELASAALPHIIVAVHATCAALVVDGSVAAAQGTRIAAARRWARGGGTFPVVIPIRARLDENASWLLIGPRPDGSVIGKDDREAIDEVLPSLRRGLIMSAAEDARRAQSRQLRARAEKLAARVAKLEAERLA